MIIHILKWLKSGARYEKAVNEIAAIAETVDALRTLQVSYLSCGLRFHAQVLEEIIARHVRRARRLNSVVRVVKTS